LLSFHQLLLILICFSLFFSFSFYSSAPPLDLHSFPTRRSSDLWLTGREDSPWYPTMRLFRQRNPGNWPEVFERVAAELAAGQLRSEEHTSELQSLAYLVCRLLLEKKKKKKKNIIKRRHK